ncbi:hypothetical protein D3C73_486780 [compost metagenome]
MTTSQRIVAPQCCGGTFVDAFNGARGQAHVNATETLSDTGVARRIALPELTTAFQIQCRHATLIAGNVQRTAGQQQTAVDVDYALQFRTTLWNRDPLFPDRHAVGNVQSDHFTGRQASHREAVGNQRCAGATQGQHGRGAVIHPALSTGGSIQTDQTIVLSLYHHHVAVVGWRREDFAVHTSAPLLFTVAGVQSNDFAAQRTDQNQTVTHANGAGDRQVKILLPFHVAIAAIHGHHHAGYIGGVDGVTVDRRHQHVVGFALTVTDRTTPLLVQNHFFFEVGQFSRWQFFLAVAAATRGQKGQSQQCCMLPTDHVTHPLWPGRRA